MSSFVWRSFVILWIFCVFLVVLHCFVTFASLLLSCFLSCSFLYFYFCFVVWFYWCFWVASWYFLLISAFILRSKLRLERFLIKFYCSNFCNIFSFFFVSFYFGCCLSSWYGVVVTFFVFDFQFFSVKQFFVFLCFV